MADHVIRTVPLDELMRYPRNPKQHDLGALIGSYAAFGYVMPILVNETNSMILAGHGRLDGLWEMWNADPAAPPDRVKANKLGMWIIPVLVVTLPADQHEGYLIADNRHTELGGWDESALFDMLSDLASADMLVGTGFDGDDVDEIGARLNPGSFIDGSILGADARDNNNLQRMGSGPGDTLRLECGEIMTTIHREIYDKLWGILEHESNRRAVIEEIICGGMDAR